MIYPAYVNSKKTIEEGRRIAKSKVKVFFYLYSDVKCYHCIQAADNPTCAEMRDVCASQGLRVEVEVCLHCIIYCQPLCTHAVEYCIGWGSLQLFFTQYMPSAKQDVDFSINKPLHPLLTLLLLVKCSQY